MSKIAVVLMDGAQPVPLVKAVRPVLSLSIQEIRRRAQPKSLLAEFVLLRSDHEEVLGRLRALVKALDAANIRYRCFYLDEAERWPDVSRSESVELSSEQLLNVLERMEEESARQWELMERGD